MFRQARQIAAIELAPRVITLIYVPELQDHDTRLQVTDSGGAHTRALKITPVLKPIDLADRPLLYTDGIIEATFSDGEPFVLGA